MPESLSQVPPLRSTTLNGYKVEWRKMLDQKETALGRPFRVQVSFCVFHCVPEIVNRRTWRFCGRVRPLGGLGTSSYPKRRPTHG